MNTAAALALVEITVYAGQYVGEPLYCGGYYDESMEPWVAVPVELLEDGTFECGQKIGVWANGEAHIFVVGDAIARGDWYVIQPDGTWLPILFDVPQPHAWFDGLSTSDTWWDVSAVQEEFERRVRYPPY